MKIKPYNKDEQPLTVGELIQKLKKLDPDKPMYVSYTDHTDWQYRTPLRLNEIRELNVGIEREVKQPLQEIHPQSYGSYYVDYVDTDIIDIEMVEYFLSDEDDDEAPF